MRRWSQSASASTPSPFDRDEVALDAEQLLDRALRLLVAALAEVVVADDALRVDEVERRPVVVVERVPDVVVVVDRDRVVDPSLRRRLPHPVDLVLERELRRVDADDDQPVVSVGLRPRPDVRLRAQPVDARQRPEVHEHDVAAQLGGAERLGVEPLGRSVERGHVPAFRVSPPPMRRIGSAATMTLFERLHMPSLDGATGWLNSEPLGPAELRGHVVLVNFWTLTCINWLRTEPYVRAWSQAYRDDGLIVIGVHTPEFSFEHEIDRVRQATKERGIDYPVAVDNDYEVWSAFDNHYWPALYFVDARRHHPRPPLRRGPLRAVGARHPAAARRRARARLRSKGSAWRRRPTGTTCGRPRPISATGAASTSRHRTAPRSTSAAPTSSPSSLRLNHWALAGEWTIGREKRRARRGRREHRLPVPRARRASRAVSGSARADSLPRAPRRRGSGPVARRGRRRGRQRRAPGRPPLPARARARRRSASGRWRSRSSSPAPRRTSFTFG